MRPVVVSVGPLTAASANNIALSQSLASAGAVTLNGSTVTGGVATLDHARRIGVTSAGNDSALTWTLSGTDWAGNPISETFAGANVGVASSVLDYLTVTSLVASAATAAAITVGTTAIAGSPWVRFDEWAYGPVGIQFSVSGTVNYTLNTTQDDVNDVAAPIARNAVVWDISGSPVIGATATTTISLATAPRFARVLLNSGSGTVTATFNQYGVAPI
jgi:hypothetical protein